MFLLIENISHPGWRRPLGCHVEMEIENKIARRGGREAEHIVESWFSNQDKTNEVGGDQDIEDVDKGGNLGGFAAGSSTLRGPWKER